MQMKGRGNMKLRTEQGMHLCETSTVYGQSEYIGIHALAAAANSLAAAGASCLGAGIRIEYPLRIDKSKIYQIEKNIKKICKERQIKLLESGLYANPMLTVPAVSVTGLAGISQKTEVQEDLRKTDAGLDIVLCGCIGTDGMVQIAQERREELSRRFSPSFIRQILSHRAEIFAGKEIAIAKDKKIPVIRQITEGGIFAALWNLAKELDTGLELDMKQFLILQETVEVCEHFRINPYQLTSAGSFLMLTEDGEALTDALAAEDIRAAQIGRTTDNKDKIIRNGEDVRYIDRPAPDEIFKIYTGGQAYD